MLAPYIYMAKNPYSDRMVAWQVSIGIKEGYRESEDARCILLEGTIPFRGFASSGLATGERVNESMSAKRRYSDGPIEEVELVDDFLPSPDELAFKEDTVKVTITLSKSSVDFFKAKASEHDTAYQKMIRRLLDSYVDRHSGT
ncbi:MAG: hypothetical protein U5O39_05585 [Gammaproteobacteria bacterium]|nr:hypothetical protein [Gammaproteobacteria bacterium]